MKSVSICMQWFLLAKKRKEIYNRIVGKSKKAAFKRADKNKRKDKKMFFFLPHTLSLRIHPTFSIKSYTLPLLSNLTLVRAKRFLSKICMVGGVTKTKFLSKVFVKDLYGRRGKCFLYAFACTLPLLTPYPFGVGEARCFCQPFIKSLTPYHTKG